MIEDVAMTNGDTIEWIGTRELESLSCDGESTERALQQDHDTSPANVMLVPTSHMKVRDDQVGTGEIRTSQEDGNSLDSQPASDKAQEPEAICSVEETTPHETLASVAQEELPELEWNHNPKGTKVHIIHSGVKPPDDKEVRAVAAEIKKLAEHLHATIATDTEADAGVSRIIESHPWATKRSLRKDLATARESMRLASAKATAATFSFRKGAIKRAQRLAMCKNILHAFRSDFDNLYSCSEDLARFSMTRCAFHKVNWITTSRAQRLSIRGSSTIVVGDTGSGKTEYADALSTEIDGTWGPDHNGTKLDFVRRASSSSLLHIVHAEDCRGRTYTWGEIAPCSADKASFFL